MLSSNAYELAQIALVEAQTRQTAVSTILDVATQFDQETILKKLCEQFDLDYEEIKDKLPEEVPEVPVNEAMAALKNAPTEPDVMTDA